MTVVHVDEWLTVHHGDCRVVLASLPDDSVHCVVTSPPYWGLRDYGVPGQLGLEATPEEYVADLVAVFRQVRRVLRADGTVWLNLGDSYAAKRRGSDLAWAKSRLTNPGNVQKAQAASLRDTGERHRGKGAGVKEKDLIGIPWRVAFALQEDGWYLRADIIWAKPNPMPESVTDRPTKAHEYVFLLTKSPRYYYDAAAIREPATGDHPRHVDSINEDPSARAPGQPPHTGLHRATRRDRFERDGAVADLVLPGQTHAQHRRRRTPSGWATGPGSHSTLEHNGRGPGKTGKAEDAGVVVLGRNRRSVWTIPTRPYPGAHFATFPEQLVEPCVLAGCPEGGVVLDPFAGSGTVGLVAQRLSRRAVLIDLNADYLRQSLVRNGAVPLGLAEVPA